ncbi:MAG: long-chain fatty acid--CoA ligase [Crocinitomicaceae bacterium]|nr:long-chain fatty acid--CoA ligase [Crocinitomicaceae bacterium]|tara:strand:- start:6502 stop:8268 length:1767 start_codon:yes stop_codon:yes gene_type:complete
MYEEVKRLFDVPRYQLNNHPQSDALVAKVGGKWVKSSIQETLDTADRASRAFLKLGIKPGDKIAIISNNRPEWVMLDCGILQIGAVDVPIYSTISEDDYRYIFNDAEVKMCFVSDEELFQKVSSIKSDVASLTNIYTFENVEGAIHWESFLKEGDGGDQEEVEKIKEGVKEDDLATLIYTSGTTGTPKGVMLSHKNIASNSKASILRLPVDTTAKALSFLPVCHVYERMLIYLYMLKGVSIYFAESMETIGDDLRDVKPEVFTAVPRLLEKVFDKIVNKGAELSGIKRALFFWALDLGERYEPYGANGFWYEFQLGIARKIIFSKWQEALGGNVLAVASGSAALQPRLARVFNAAGIPVMEGYGLTETSPVVSVNCEGDKGLMIGTVGRVIDDVEVKIADDGEILVKGPNVMQGYYKKPDKTSEVLKDGWFHTGDIGEIVGDRFLKITDRKKEIFKTSGGKYIAPQVMENKFKESRFIEQIMVIGEGQKHAAALIVPAFEFLEEWCNRKGIEFGSTEKIIANDRVVARIQKEVDHFNEGFGKWETIKKFELIGQVWGIDTGELTPTLKLKRKAILSKYEDLHKKIYEL